MTTERNLRCRITLRIIFQLKKKITDMERGNRIIQPSTILSQIKKAGKVKRVQVWTRVLKARIEVSGGNTILYRKTKKSVPAESKVSPKPANTHPYPSIQPTTSAQILNKTTPAARKEITGLLKSASPIREQHKMPLPLSHFLRKKYRLRKLLF